MAGSMPVNHVHGRPRITDGVDCSLVSLNIQSRSVVQREKKQYSIAKQETSADFGSRVAIFKQQTLQWLLTYGPSCLAYSLSRV